MFVTLDGPGGVGKSTTTEHLHRYLTGQGYSVHTTSEPSHGPLGKIARHGTDTYSGYVLACLVAADRYHHLATDIRPNLAAGWIVVCDRYVPRLTCCSSWMAYRSNSSKRSTPLPMSQTLRSSSLPTRQSPPVGSVYGARTADSKQASPPVGPKPTSTETPPHDSPNSISATHHRHHRDPAAQVAAAIAGRIAQLAGVPQGIPTPT